MMGMIDALVGYSPVPIAPSNGATERKRTSGGVSVVSTGNASHALLSPAGISRGLSLDASGMVDDTFGGKVSLTMLGIALLLLVGFYVWTRDVQGGG